MKKLIFVLLALASTFAFSQTTVAPFVNPKVQFFNGAAPCSGCLLSTFAAGQSTPLATYSESTGTTPNANPVVLDANGMASIYLTSASYKFVLKTAANVTIWTQDGVSWLTPLTTFPQGSVAGNFDITQPTAAINGANQSSFSSCIHGTFFNVASLDDKWCFQNVIGTGTSPTSTLTLTHSGSSGAATFSIPGNVSVGGTLGVTSINGIVKCDKSSGADVGAQINACIASLPSTGGTADARGFQGAQTISTQIVIQKPIRILWGDAVFSCTVIPCVVIGGSARVETVEFIGRGISMNTVSSTQGTAFKYTGGASASGVIQAKSVRLSHFQGFTVDCNSLAAMGTDYTATNAIGGSFSNTFEDIVNENCTNGNGWGMHIGSTSNDQVSETWIRHVIGFNNNDGFHQDGNQTFNIYYDYNQDSENIANGFNIRAGAAYITHLQGGDNTPVMVRAGTPELLYGDYWEWETSAHPGGSQQLFVAEDSSVFKYVDLQHLRTNCATGSGNFIQWGSSTGALGIFAIRNSDFTTAQVSSVCNINVLGQNGGTGPVIFIEHANKYFTSPAAVTVTTATASAGTGGVFRSSFSDTIHMSDGSSSAPSYSFNSSTNTGMWWDSANSRIVFPVNGSSALELSTSNVTFRLGIQRLIEVVAPGCAASSDFIWGDSTAHRAKMCNNNGPALAISGIVGTGNVTTAGTAVTNGTTQDQTGITVTGAATTDACTANLGTALPATWQTGIRFWCDVTATNTVTVHLQNPTAGSITPAATQVNVTVTR